MGTATLAWNTTITAPSTSEAVRGRGLKEIPLLGLRGARSPAQIRRVAGSNEMSVKKQPSTRTKLGDGATSDEELMLAFRDGDPAAFEELVSRHKRGLYNFLLRSVHERARAEEMLQEVFLRVIRAKDRYQRTARFTTWIYTIARNLCVDESRRQKFRRTLPLEAKRRGASGDFGLSILDQTAAKQVGTDVASEGRTIKNRVAAAIETLPEDQREVFMMRQFGGLSFKQIGEAVGAPENTVKSRMRYALEKLRGELRNIDPRDRPADAKKARASG